MTSKLEQVAEAMWQAEWTRGGSGGKRRVPWSDIAPVDQERWRFIARAAIAAMELPEIHQEVAFLLERLAELDFDEDTAVARDFYGHCEPSIARLRAALKEEKP